MFICFRLGVLFADALIVNKARWAADEEQYGVCWLLHLRQGGAIVA